jgi:carbamoyltransferase
MIVLGLHGGVTLGQHEPAACLAIDGRIVALCEEERYLRIKSCYGYLPHRAIKACLKQAGLRIEDVDLVVTPGASYPDFADRWRDWLRHTFGHAPKIERVHHQKAHLAAAFYGSGLEESLVMSLDATGDASCGMLAYATRKDGIRIIEDMPTEQSLGYFYTLMTYYLGFEDGDEYKVMGLAPYGKPSVDLSRILAPADGGWRFDWRFVRDDPPPRSPFEPLYSHRVAEVLGKPNRTPDQPFDDYYRDVARSTQATMEAALMSLVAGLRARAPASRHLCYAGGVAMNCSANRLLLESGWFDRVYVPPVASDRGLALGCAYLGAVMSGDTPWPLLDAYLGTAYANADIRAELTANGSRFEEVADPAQAAADLLARGKIVGWHQGRSEAGARALGARSILASAESTAMRDLVNARIKYREEFRPFAPSMAQARVRDWFQTPGAQDDFPYMTFTLAAHPGRAEKIAAVVHVDGTARVQTVRSSENEIYHDLIRRYEAATGVPVILNTSFNLKGQPIVETPRDALMTFHGCGLDALVVGNFVVAK